MQVALHGFSKRFGERLALRRVSLEVASGTTHALLGANGSGKSTLLRAVAGLVRPTAGEALVDGVPAPSLDRASRGRIGYVGHQAMVYRGLTARENLALVARLYGRDAIDEMLAAAGLAERAGDRVDGFSRGMLQRLALARVILQAPDLVLLDEPTTGLDEDGLALLDRTLGGWRGTTTVLVATHDAAFATRHADATTTLAAGEVAG